MKKIYSLFVILFLVSGCKSLDYFNKKEKEESLLKRNIDLMAQQTLAFQASIEERDKIVIQLTDRLNRVADKLDKILQERKGLEKRIIKGEEEIEKQVKKMETIVTRNELLEKELSNARKILPRSSEEIQGLNDRIALLTRKLSVSQEKTKILGKELEAIIKMDSQYHTLVQKLGMRIQNGDVLVVNTRSSVSIGFPNSNIFLTGKIDPSEKSTELLSEVGSALKAAGEFRVEVEGHTDNVPISGLRGDSISGNDKLSLARAEKARDILAESMEVDPATITTTGYGDRYPIADNSTPAGRRKNRRVLITVSAKNAAAPSQSDAYFQFTQGKTKAP